MKHRSHERMGDEQPVSGIPVDNSNFGSNANSTELSQNQGNNNYLRVTTISSNIEEFKEQK